MKVKTANGKGEVFEVENNTARALIAAGTLVEYIPPVQCGPVPLTSWKVGWLPATTVAADLNQKITYPKIPVIIAKCDTCLCTCSLTGKTAHKTQRFTHCRVSEAVPTDIAAHYVNLLKRRDELTPKPHAEVRKPHWV